MFQYEVKERACCLIKFQYYENLRWEKNYEMERKEIEKEENGALPA